MKSLFAVTIVMEYKRVDGVLYILEYEASYSTRSTVMIEKRKKKNTNGGELLNGTDVKDSRTYSRNSSKIAQQVRRHKISEARTSIYSTVVYSSTGTVRVQAGTNSTESPLTQNSTRLELEVAGITDFGES
jgi:hypothetical protein